MVSRFLTSIFHENNASAPLLSPSISYILVIYYYTILPIKKIISFRIMKRPINRPINYQFLSVHFTMTDKST